MIHSALYIPYTTLFLLLLGNLTIAEAQTQQTPVTDVPVARITVNPSTLQLTGKDAKHQLLVSAELVNGKQRDVTRQAQYQADNPSIVKVSPNGIIQPIGDGVTNVEISFGNKRVAVSVTVKNADRFLPVDFGNDVVPILTKQGCNSGGCHGKSGGRGGLSLSLFGFNPAADYDAIVKDSRGRRLLFGSPDHSLLLLKPTGRMSHGGGRRLDPDSPEYARLHRWISTGARWNENTPTLKNITVTPASRILGYRDQQQIVVTATYSDGSIRDVTRLTEIQSNDSGIAGVDNNGMVRTLDRFGETAIVCKFQGQVGVSNVLVPLHKRTAQWPKLPRGNFIDDHIMTKLRKLNVAPSALIDDAGFLRRATLQLAGRLPTVEECNAFASDKKADKRVRLVERLMASGDYADLFAQKWSHLLRNKLRNQRTRVAGTVAFHRWIRNAIAENMPYDRFVEAILTATGNPKTNPPTQWYAEVRYLDRYVDDTAQVFLGLRIGCARCHNHPFEKYTQDDYYGLAAFFARVGRKGGTGIQERKADETIFVKHSGSVQHPVSKTAVRPHGLGSPDLTIPDYDDPRGHLVDWMRQPDNRYFARAYVNRMWAHFFGRGLVEPLDDMRDTNPAINEPLLDALADEFVKSGFNMRHIVKLIATSTTYQLSSTPNADNAKETQAFSRFYPQRMSAEVLYDSVNMVTHSKPARFANMPPGMRAVQLPHEGFSERLLDLFGRPPRESACECERIAEPSLGQSLFLMNNSTFRSKVKNAAAMLIKDKRSSQKKINALFLAALSREPRPHENRYAMEFLNAENHSVEAYSDLVWVVMNMKEFLYIL